MTYEEMKDIAVGTRLWVRMDEYDEIPCLDNILEVIFESWDEVRDSSGVKEGACTFRARSVKETATKRGILFKWLDPEKTFVSLRDAAITAAHDLDYRIKDLQNEREKLLAVAKEN